MRWWTSHSARGAWQPGPRQVLSLAMTARRRSGDTIRAVRPTSRTALWGPKMMRVTSASQEILSRTLLGMGCPVSVNAAGSKPAFSAPVGKERLQREPVRAVHSETARPINTARLFRQ